MFGLGGGNSIWLLVILSIGVVGFIIYKKKQDSKTNNSFLSSRKNKDEVWRTIKQYLKDTGRYGNKIISSYVAKRNDISYISPNESSYTRTKQKYVNKIREYQYSCEKKLVRQTNKKGD